MFKKIQNYLLINHPLLWNIKIVPLTCILIGFQLIFFLIGFASGALNFTETERNYAADNDGTVIFFSILISILTLIVWIVYYFKNNAFKSFYPKNKFSLFKEWGIIVFISFLLCSFIIIYLYGKDVRVRNYFTEKEAIQRCDILNQGSLFIGDNFKETEYIKKTVNDTLKNVPLGYVVYNNKKYSLTSIFNKKVEGFSFFEKKQDSLTEIKVKNWLQNNKKDSVHLLLKNYLKIANEHQLESNIDADKWLSIVYNYPNFEKTKIVAEFEKDYFNTYPYEEYATETVVATPPNGGKIDSINQYIKTIGKEEFVFNKTYVPAKALNYNYQKIAQTYTNPTVESDQILATLYFAIGLSLLLFSFRTSSGRNWLIALISMGVINIIIGIFSILFSSEYTYLIAIFLLTLIVFFYFIIVLRRKASKGISGITLNGLLWLTPSFIPIVYTLSLELAKQVSGYNQYNFTYNQNLETAFPKIHFMEENIISMFYLNIVFIILMMAFYSIKIKKWKGIAES